MTENRVFKFALHLKAKISAQLSLIHDIFEQRGSFLVVIGSAHNLANLRQVEAFDSCLLKQKRGDFYVFEAFGPHFEILLDHSDVLVDIQPRNVVNSPL